MVALRSARLEAVFGSRLGEVQFAQIQTVIDNQVPESFDLDFKSELYANDEKGKHASAVDVAAMANTAGGVIAMGIGDDDQARAARLLGVPLSDAEERRIRQIVGSRVVPQPVLDFVPVRNPTEKTGHGVLLIAVPRSPLAPHAVIVNNALRYPRRNGSTTDYMSEPEVASAYRERFAGGHRQADRAQQIEHDALLRLATTDDQLWVVVSLVPDLPGELVIDQAALTAARAELREQRPLIMPNSLQWVRVNIGRRRLLVDGTMDSSRVARFLAADLHHDGAGVFGAYVLDQLSTAASATPGAPLLRGANDELVVNGILSGLRFLARHARDRAAAGGNALIRAQLYPVTGQQQVQLSQRRGIMASVGTQVLASMPVPGERVAPIESLAADGPELVSAAYLLATDIFQDFGHAEAMQLTRTGEVRLGYWGTDIQPHVKGWAQPAGITVIEQM
jgi:Putative DNA-binding domain